MSGQLCWPPSKSHMADCILFEKESDFHMAFVLAVGWPTWESAHELYLIEYLFQNMSIYVYQNFIINMIIINRVFNTIKTLID